MTELPATTNDTVQWDTSTIRRNKRLRQELVLVELEGTVIEPVGRHLLRVRVTEPHEDRGRVLLVPRDKARVI